jgi:hypothetical protein
VTVREIVQEYLKKNGYDGLHSHAEDNRYAGCGCGIDDLMMDCGFQCDDCEPAYLHSLFGCVKCLDYSECEPEKNPAFCGQKEIRKK